MAAVYLDVNRAYPQAILSIGAYVWWYIKNPVQYAAGVEACGCASKACEERSVRDC